jgi:hypothetical protein
MHPLFEKASGLTEMIIAGAIEVHRDKGPGLIESIYEWCLLKELGLRGLACINLCFLSYLLLKFIRPPAQRTDPGIVRCQIQGSGRK